MTTQDETQDTLTDVPKEFHSVVQAHGREMWALVMNVQMAGIAVERLAAFADKHKSQHAAHAVGVLANAFNQLSNAYVAKMGWTQEMLVQCDRDLQMAFKGKIVVPGSALILNS